KARQVTYMGPNQRIHAVGRESATLPRGTQPGSAGLPAGDAQRYTDDQWGEVTIAKYVACFPVLQ
ncbi:MAG: hypothetical protein ACKPBV_03650, partial [Sphaerospermopsis kisseleviana]